MLCGPGTYYDIGWTLREKNAMLNWPKCDPNNSVRPDCTGTFSTAAKCGARCLMKAALSGQPIEAMEYMNSLIHGQYWDGFMGSCVCYGPGHTGYSGAGYVKLLAERGYVAQKCSEEQPPLPLQTLSEKKT